MMALSVLETRLEQETPATAATAPGHGNHWLGVVTMQDRMSERWLPVVGYEGLYEVSDQGHIRTGHHRDSIARGRAGNLKSLLTNSSNGYAYACLCRDGKKYRHSVHTLVARAFLGLCPEGMEVCHDNGDKADNRASNLRYDTRSGNHLDKWQHGTMPHGTSHPNSKLTELDIRQIRSAYPAETLASLADRYGVSPGHVHDIVIRKAWKWVA